MKRIVSIIFVIALLTVTALAETAYPTITLDSEDYGIGTVYMADSMITTDAINPMTTAAYTEEEIEALKSGEDSIDLDDGYVLALTVNGTDEYFQYTSEEAALILEYTDPLKLNAENGEVTTMDGTVVVPADEQ